MVDKIECDKLFVKYHPEEEAYNVARTWFLLNTDYTHLAILPDDLLVTQKDFQYLNHDAETHNVVSGWCRNTIRLTPWWTGEPEKEDDADTNISLRSLPPDPPAQGTYEGYHFESVKSILELADMFYHMPTVKPIIPVLYAGFPFTFISRMVVEEVPFRRQECCVDSCFSLDLNKKKIKQYVDLRVRTVHMNRHPSEIQVGNKNKEIIFEEK
jgi:hypothetical protein